jgi:hypothetical protein
MYTPGPRGGLATEEVAMQAKQQSNKRELGAVSDSIQQSTQRWTRHPLSIQWTVSVSPGLYEFDATDNCLARQSGDCSISTAPLGTYASKYGCG